MKRNIFNLGGIETKRKCDLHELQSIYHVRRRIEMKWRKKVTTKY